MNFSLKPLKPVFYQYSWCKGKTIARNGNCRNVFMPSTVIKKYEYHPERKVLTIEYLSGLIYDYLDVPKMVYDEFRGAFSKGTFLNRHIKGKFEFVRRK